MKEEGRGGSWRNRDGGFRKEVKEVGLEEERGCSGKAEGKEIEGVGKM